MAPTREAPERESPPMGRMGWGGLPIEVTYFLCVGGLSLAPMFVWAIHLSGREIGSFRMRDILALALGTVA